MPRSRIDIPDRIDRLSILDENGNVDTELVPDVTDAFLVKLYRYMVLGRRLDARQLNLQRQGRIGTFPPITGQEAAHLGATAALKESDWFIPSFRETVGELWRGRSVQSIIMGNNGFAEAATVDPPRNDLPISIPVGSQILHAVGIAWSMAYRRTDNVAMTFFGDGATSEGDFHEGLNFAGVFKIPAVFICQNNHWAISIPRHRQTQSATLAQKAIAYGLPGIQVDGNDILAVYTAAAEAVARARAGDGPTLIEAITYRMMMHTTADDPKRYRTDEEVAKWTARDPIARFETYLKNTNRLTTADMKAIAESADATIEEGVNAAEEAMAGTPDPLVMFDHAYAERPPYLEEQRDAFIQEQQEAAAAPGGDHG